VSSFDIVVLGGGSGGYACALRAAQLGKSVALIERDKLGGTCLHWGCIPTKALLHAAGVADEARHGPDVGVRSTFEGIDMPAVNAYKDGVVARLYKGLQGLVKSRKITYVEGTGRLVAPNAVEVDGTRYEAPAVVLATGSYSRTLPGLEIDGTRVISSYEALALDYVPGRVVVLGGGVIGVEFASVWRSFGAEVTIVEALPRLVPAEDEACSKALERAFRKRGIGFKTGVRFSGVEHVDNGVRVSLENGDSLEADIMLVAVGRGPNTSDLG
jgi:dihydrolipoamide dehydrogenase